MKEIILKECFKHGMTEHVLDSNNRYRCKKCRIEAVSSKRRRDREKLVEYKGGKCEICGYDKCIDALEFHHKNPDEKEFGLSCGNTIKFEEKKKEADKCILVCSNCHREIHFKLNEEKRKLENDRIEANKLNYLSSGKRPHVKHKINDDLVESIKNDYKKHTQKEICQKYCLSTSTLRRLLKNNGIIKENKIHKNKPTKEELLGMIKTMSMLAIGRKYGVSDHSVRKWCKDYNLPFKKDDIKNYNTQT